MEIKMTRLILDAETNEVSIQELTAEELADLEQGRIQYEARLADKTAKSQAKAALLERLGITADEAALLLG